MMKLETYENEKKTEGGVVSPDITSLMRAATEEDPSILIRMLSSENYKATLFMKDGKGRTALDWARMCRNYNAVSLLMKAMSSGFYDARLETVSSSIDLETYLRGVNKHQADSLLQTIRERNVLQTLRILNENRLYREEVEGIGEVFFADMPGYCGYSPLIMACGLNIIEVVTALLSLNVPVDHENKFGHTAFTYACAAGNSEIVRLLLFHGANPHHQTAEGKTGLHYACMYAKPRTVQTVLDFQVQQFMTFRVEGHSHIAFDYTRWLKYSDILLRLIDCKDNQGHKASDMLPVQPLSAEQIETKLRLRRVKSIPLLSTVTNPASDVWSVAPNRNFAQDMHSEVSRSDHKPKGNEYTGEELSWKDLNEDDNSELDEMLYINDEIQQPQPLGIAMQPHTGQEIVLMPNESAAVAESVGSLNSDWWSHDTDNLHATSIHNIQDVHSLPSIDGIEESNKAIHKLFRDCRARIAVWSDAAEKERQLAMVITCPLACGAQCRVEDLTTHVRDVCPFRETQCGKCHELVRHVDLDNHTIKKCPKRLVACPNAYSGCSEMMTFDSLETHMHLKCKLRPMCCRQLCEAVIPLNKRDDHEQIHCKNRHISCDQCREEMIARDYTAHLKQSCPKRAVKCSIGCGQSFPAEFIAHHETQECLQPCKWECGAIVGPPERLKLHEFHECKQRQVECSHGCGVKHLTAEFAGFHEEHQCGKKLQPCVLGCGKSVFREDMNGHCDSWSGSCPERQVRCPSNLVGWRIVIPSTRMEGIVMKHKGGVNAEGEKTDLMYVRFSKEQVWLDCWDTQFVLVNKAQRGTAEFTCGWLTRSCVQHHLECQCVNRTVLVPGKEDAAASLAGQSTTVLKAIEMAVTRDKVDTFIHDTVHTPAVLCPHCSKEIKTSDQSSQNDPDVLTELLNKHIAECDEAPLRCPYGCGDILLRKYLSNHVNEQCPKRLVTCVVCMDADLWAEELEEHSASRCPKRPAQCPLGCGEEGLHVSNVDDHVRDICPLRIVMCSCGFSMEQRMLAEHLLLHCNDRDINCPQGCGKLLRQSEVEQHVTFLCVNKHFKYQKIVDCPNSCGLRLMQREVLEHVSYHCPNRLTECPLNCGIVVQLDRLKIHLQICPMRAMSCEPGMKSCDRLLHKWFYRESREVRSLPEDSSMSLLDEDGTVGDMSSLLVSGVHPGGEAFSVNPHSSQKLLSDEVSINTYQNSLHQHSASEVINGHTANGGEITEYDKQQALLPLFTAHQGEDTKKETMFQNSNFAIEFSKKQTFFQSVKIKRSRSRLPDADDDGDDTHGGGSHASHDSDSSVFYDGFQMRLHRQIRMHCCRRHKVTLIAASVRYNDYVLAEYILKQVKECEDIDLESQSGDTALTLACRLGRIDFVQLLLQHGADVNKETTTGRTALIEAVRASEEHVPILEYLVKAGCIVAYKTAKHRKTALNWAKKMDRPQTIRILELAAVVQRQSNMLFNAISCGEYEIVNRIVADGDFFDPNAEAKCYAEMMRFGVLLDESDRVTTRAKAQLTGLTEKVEAAKAISNESVGALKSVEVDLADTFREQEALNRSIANEFAVFEQASLRLTAVDVEEIRSLVAPQYLLRLSVLVYGVMFEFLPFAETSDAKTMCSVQSCKSWWSGLVKTFTNSMDVVQKIRAYSLDRVQKMRYKPLVGCAKPLLLALSAAVSEVRQESRPSSQSATYRSASMTRSVTETTLNTAGTSTPSASRPGTSDMRPITPAAPPSFANIIDDEVGSSGTWIKGEWVADTPGVKAANNTRITSSNKQKLVYLSDSVIESELRKVGRFKDDNTPLSAEALAAQQAQQQLLAESAQQLTVNTTRPGSAGPSLGRVAQVVSKNKRKKKKSAIVYGDKVSLSGDPSLDALLTRDMLAGLTVDDVESFAFVSAMCQLVKAVVFYATNKVRLDELKRTSSSQSISASDMRLQAKAEFAQYQEVFRHREKQEKDLVDSMKRTRRLEQKMKGFREKVRVARLMNEVSVSGHTLVSWAACNGSYEVVENILTHGGTVGYPAHLLHLTATFIQLSYRIYCKYSEAKYKSAMRKTLEKLSTVATSNEDNSMGKSRKSEALEAIREICELKERREKLLANIYFQRTKLRFPVPEAIYAGKWEIVKRIFERRLWHVHFSHSWIFPSAPQPFQRRLEHLYEHKKLTPVQILAHGMNDLSAGTYIAEVGWVPPGDPREPYGELQTELTAILKEVEEKRVKFLAGRFRVRALVNEKKNQRSGEIEMLIAIQHSDYRKCMYLAERRGITIDLETKNGLTVLVAAAMENVESVNHTYMVNDDGRPCLIVEYLLDRIYFRPSVDLETVSGHTALIRACSLARSHVVEALLDRGANINYVNKYGRTALHYTAALGNTDCTRILIERFADQTIRDCNGQTPYEIADQENFTNVMKLLSQFRGGFLGPVQISRGRVNNTISCPLGCGASMFPREAAAHCLECKLRTVPCPNNCGEMRLMCKEVPEHLEFSCPVRTVQCELCGDSCEFQQMPKHKKRDCSHRMVPCALNCGRNYKFCEVERHMAHCDWRIIPCPLLCYVNVTINESEHHMKNICENRRVPCPLKCRGLIVAKQIDQHMAEQCPCRLQPCQHCNNQFSKREVEAHETQCEVRKEPCSAKCGDLVCVSDLQRHLLEECRFRLIGCSLLCGRKVRAVNMPLHQSTECENRLVKCEYGCISSEASAGSDEPVITCIPFKRMLLHLKHDCPERANKCSLCLLPVKAKNVDFHNAEECTRRVTNCRNQGCYKTLPLCEREEHERFTCRFRQVLCAQGCGQNVLALHAGIHETKSCEMRFVECTARCGMKPRFCDLETHLKLECVRR